MKTVIYHSADHDGIFCREIARHFLGDMEVNYIGWNFGDSKLEFPHLGEVYIMDLSPECLKDDFDDLDVGRMIWIDHHKSSIEKYPTGTPGYRIDGVAACRLAWQWFAAHVINEAGLPSKQQFIDRKVSEPLAVRLAGEYDIWDHRGDGDLELQFGLRCMDPLPWGDLLTPSGVGKDQTVNHLIGLGKAAMAYSSHIDANLVTHRSYRLDWEGLNFIVLNTGRFNSLTFAALDKPETGHDALLGYMFNGKCWTVSLYHAKHRTDLDLSLIAVKNGGGGHRGACGFTCSKLPFMT
jgi:hypothetical protein